VLKGFLHVLSHPEPEAKIKNDQNGGEKEMISLCSSSGIVFTTLHFLLNLRTEQRALKNVGTACFKKCKTIISIPTFTLTMRHVVIKALIYI